MFSVKSPNVQIFTYDKYSYKKIHLRCFVKTTLGVVSDRSSNDVIDKRKKILDGYFCIVFDT